MRHLNLLLAVAACASMNILLLAETRPSTILESGWRFMQGEITNAA